VNRFAPHDVQVLKNPFPLLLSEEIQKEILSTSEFPPIVVINEFKRTTPSAQGVKPCIAPRWKDHGNGTGNRPAKELPVMTCVRPSTIFKAQANSHAEIGEEGKEL